MPNGPFRVFWSSKAMAAIKAIGKKARQARKSQVLARVLQELNVKLLTPLDFGEITWAKGNIIEHLAVHVFLSVNFAIDSERRLVLVKDCHALSGRGM